MKNKLKFHMLIANVLMIASVCLALAGFVTGRMQERIHPLLWVGLGLSVGSVVYKLFTLKCPHCDSFLRTKYKLPQTCPACGRSIFEEETPHEENHP